MLGDADANDPSLIGISPEPGLTYQRADGRPLSVATSCSKLKLSSERVPEAPMPDRNRVWLIQDKTPIAATPKGKPVGFVLGVLSAQRWHTRSGWSEISFTLPGVSINGWVPSKAVSSKAVFDMLTSDDNGSAGVLGGGAARSVRRICSASVEVSAMKRRNAATIERVGTLAGGGEFLEGERVGESVAIDVHLGTFGLQLADDTTLVARAADLGKNCR